MPEKTLKIKIGDTEYSIISEVVEGRKAVYKGREFIGTFEERDGQYYVFEDGGQWIHAEGIEDVTQLIPKIIEIRDNKFKKDWEEMRVAGLTKK